jgi:mono/diheme cytochrome c family protein
MTMRNSTVLAAIMIATPLLAAFPATAQETPRKNLLEGIDAGTPGPQLFMRAYEVFSHPRCSNCHPHARPPWWDIKTKRVHGMNVQRGEEDEHGAYGLPGMKCVTCHREQNGTLAGSPPGAPPEFAPKSEPEFLPHAHGWRLAPKGMGWGGKPPVEMCNQIKIQDVDGKGPVAHIVGSNPDPLVKWAWDPGPGRESAPGKFEHFVQLMKWWEMKWQGQNEVCPLTN